MTSPKSKTNQPIARAVAFIAVFCLLASLALVRNGSLFGREAASLFSASSPEADTVSAIQSGGNHEVINTTTLGKDISGYAGPVPVEIYVTDGVIDSVVPLPNSETPKFFRRLEAGGLTTAWNGKTLSEAATMPSTALPAPPIPLTPLYPMCAPERPMLRAPRPPPQPRYPWQLLPPS